MYKMTGANRIVQPTSPSPTNPTMSLENSPSPRNGGIDDDSGLQFKNYTVNNPPVFPSSEHHDPLVTPSHYPTPNHTPIPQPNLSYPPSAVLSKSSSSLSPPTGQTLNSSQPVQRDPPSRGSPPAPRRTSVTASNLAKQIGDLLPPNIQRDANGYPILSREFVVRRISEGETGRLKEELKCEACGKGYKHITSLAKHLWEHTAEWQTTKKLLISKHQQAQLLEAASILCSVSERESVNSSSNVHSVPVSSAPSALTSNTTTNTTNPKAATTAATTTTTTTTTLNAPVSRQHAFNDYSPFDKDHNKLVPVNEHGNSVVSLATRRKSKTEYTKAGKFGGKRRSKSFVIQNQPVPLNQSQALSPLRKMSGMEIHDESDMGMSSRRNSTSANPPIDLRRPSVHSMRPSFGVSVSRRGSLLGSLIKEEPKSESSGAIYDSEEED